MNARSRSGTAGRRVVGTSPRVLIALGSFEARRLIGHPLTLVAFGAAVISGIVIALDEVPRWWIWDVRLGTLMLGPAGATLLASHLATGRAQRDNMTSLYDSLPTSARKRWASNLLGIAGPLGGGLIFIAADVTWLNVRAAIGAPRPAVLAGAVLLVILAGGTGVALGTWLPHPMTGIATLLIVGACEAAVVIHFESLPAVSAKVASVLPWAQPDVLEKLPGPFPDLPAAGPHVLELVALIGLVTLIVHGRKSTRRHTAVVIAIASVLAATVGWAGWLQTRPTPLAQLNDLVSAATNPASAQQCTSRSEVLYCHYPSYLNEVPQWSMTVDAVLNHVPGKVGPNGSPLVVRQVIGPDSNFLDNSPILTGERDGSRRSQQMTALQEKLSQFQLSLETNANAVAGSASPPVYVGLTWGQGPSLGNSQFGLAIAVAHWAVGLPTTEHLEAGGAISCLPVGQAREAVALWLAASATSATKQNFLAAMAGELAAPVTVDGQPTPVYSLQFDVNAIQLSLTTAVGGQLAKAMLELPRTQVEAVLLSRWSYWLDWKTRDVDLAMALGIPLPPAPANRHDDGTTSGVGLGTPVPRPLCR